ncbi:Sua5/YciO/YrdC/YwlC family protein [Candidatus Gracilibacteria bacterium]|nr:Sua5/YciO/YrdC/YwlC family protein [Candidatus Gracilibacteria bacterium]
MLQIIPTDTCYGLVGEYNEADYDEIYQLKSRSFEKPLALVVRDFEDIKKYGRISDEQVNFLKKYLHPFSVLVPRVWDFPFDFDREKYRYLSIRVASVCFSKNLKNTLKFPLFLTSANPSGQAEAQDFLQAKKYFPEIDGFDGGICNQKPSDIFRFTESGEVEYLRKNYL